MRRRPRQSRSRATVEAIEQAAALILEKGDSARLTTNHVAERAGVSIGSIYEYFADKDDILHACAEAEADRMREELEAYWSANAPHSDAELNWRKVLALPLAPFRGRPALAQAMLHRYATSPWALVLALRQLETFLESIGETKAQEIFRRSRERVGALMPLVATRIVNRFTVNERRLFPLFV